jgi:hypothetical protein
MMWLKSTNHPASIRDCKSGMEFNVSAAICFIAAQMIEPGSSVR